MSGGRLGRPNRVTPARARAEIDALAAAGDIAGLRRLGQSLPPLLAFTYERRRAAALALALEGSLDAALSEHALGRAALGTAPATVAEDAALLRRLAHGEPAAAEPAFDLRPLYGVAAVAATIALTVGVTLRLVAVDPSLPAIEAPPDHADTFVRVARPAPGQSDDHAQAARGSASAPGAPEASQAVATFAQSEGPAAQRPSRRARSTPRPTTTRPPKPTAPPPAAPAPPPPAAPAPAPAEPAAEPLPSNRTSAPAPPPEPSAKPGRRRGHEKHAKKARAPESPAPAAPAQEPAPAAEQPQPAADESHGPPEHANNDKDKEPKDPPGQQKR